MAAATSQVSGLPCSSTAVTDSVLSSLSHVGKTLFEYVSELGKAEVDLLYAHSQSVRVIFREAVPAVAQQLVMRLIFGGARPFQESVLKRWCATLSALPHTAYLTVLQHLQILQKAQAKANQPAQLMLHKAFQASLAAYLQGDGQGSVLGSGPKKEASTELLQHAVSSWDRFLQQLLEPVKSSSIAADLAISLNFKDASGLTAAGFQFVLDERQQQLWQLVISYLKSAKAENPLGPLKIVLAMGELRVGECLIMASSTTQLEQRFLKFLTELGVLYMESPGQGQSCRFWITPGALAMFRRDASQMLSRSGTSSQEILGVTEDSQGIIVESNFKVYCYTSSSLHALLLGHFCEILVRLPNLVVGQLTAESVMKAMSHGIRAAHMLRYLEAAAHPRVRQGARDAREGAAVPSNVCGQLEAEPKRVFFTVLALHSFDPSKSLHSLHRRSGSPAVPGRRPQRQSSLSGSREMRTPLRQPSRWRKPQEPRNPKKEGSKGPPGIACSQEASSGHVDWKQIEPRCFWFAQMLRHQSESCYARSPRSPRSLQLLHRA